MGLEPPSELIPVLDALGFAWPEPDETALVEMGRAWLAFPDRLSTVVDDAQCAAERVWADNADSAVEAFRAAWGEADSARVNLDDGATAASLIGVGLLVCAGIVIALKINVIVQLVLLVIEIAQAVATAVATMGASLAEIPILREITSTILDQLLGYATDAVLGG